MIWCRFQKDKLAAYGIVEGERVRAVEGDPFPTIAWARTNSA
jgi:hypothetical protein